MKNLFFALAFMFIGSVAFANNTTNEVLSTNTIELTESTSEIVNAVEDVLVVVTIIDYYDEDGEYLGSDIYVDVYIIE